MLESRESSYTARETTEGRAFSEAPTSRLQELAREPKPLCCAGLASRGCVWDIRLASQVLLAIHTGFHCIVKSQALESYVGITII